MITYPATSDTHVDFEVIDGPLHDGSDSIGFKPFFGVPLDAGGHTQLHMFVGIGSSAMFGGAVRVLTLTNRAMVVSHFGAPPFIFDPPVPFPW